MKAKSLIRFVMILVLILFFSLYFTTMSGYYEYSKNKKTILTEDAIRRFEEDVSNGKEVVAGNYLEDEVDYSNGASKIGMKLSSVIEKGFDKMMGGLFKQIEKTVNE